MSKSRMEVKENNPKANEKIFFVCDQCLWTVTCLDKKYLNELFEISDIEHNCPVCKGDQLSSFPLTHNDSYTYNHSRKRGLEISFK